MPARAATRIRSRAESAARIRTLGHELGNLLAAVRLSAHLIESEKSVAERRELARAQQRLVAHSAALLGLVRPLVDPKGVSGDILSTALLLTSARRALDDCLPTGLDLRVAKGLRLPDVRADADVIHHVMVACLASAIEVAAGKVSLRARHEGRRVNLVIADDGASGDARDRDAARGRPFLVEIADEILRPLDGRARFEPSRKGTKVLLSLVAAGPVGPAGRAGRA